MRCRLIGSVLAVAILLFPTLMASASENTLPQPDHVVVVIFENHSFNQIMNPNHTSFIHKLERSFENHSFNQIIHSVAHTVKSQIMNSNHAPFIHSLARGGALFINSFAVAHPSQPNYFALFSGSTQGVHDDGNHTINAPNIADAFVAAHKKFIGYIETGSPREHNPWESFTNLREVEQNLSEFPSDFAQLPTVSFVIPNLDHDMHNESISDGDVWLRLHLGSYAKWSKAHNSLLIITFDEDNDHAGNHILTIFYGACVRPGSYATHITHYSVVSTLLAMYALPRFAEATTTPPIRTIWDKNARCRR